MTVKSDYKRDGKQKRNKKDSEKGCWDNTLMFICLCVYVTDGG